MDNRDLIGVKVIYQKEMKKLPAGEIGELVDIRKGDFWIVQYKQHFGKSLVSVICASKKYFKIIDGQH